MAWRSRTSSCTSSASYACVVALLVSALASCSGKSDSVAMVAMAEGVVTRQVGHGESKPASRGTLYYLSDAAVTGEGTATLDVVGGATIVMTRTTTVRFNGTRDK